MAQFNSWRMGFDTLPAEKKSSMDPPGYSPQHAKDLNYSSSATKKKDPAMQQRKQEALMARAQAPLKQVGFMMFMMWMSGNSIQIFSIMITISGLSAPIMAMLKCKEAFPSDPEWKLNVIMPRIVYCSIHMAQVLFSLYKLNAMGLLPTHASDWVSAIAVPQSLEFAYSPL